MPEEMAITITYVTRNKPEQYSKRIATETANARQQLIRPINSSVSACCNSLLTMVLSQLWFTDNQLVLVTSPFRLLQPECSFCRMGFSHRHRLGLCHAAHYCKFLLLDCIVSLSFGKQVEPILLILSYNGSLVASLLHGLSLLHFVLPYAGNTFIRDFVWFLLLVCIILLYNRIDADG